MNYYLIADLDAKKFNIYHINDNKDFYDNFRTFMVKQTGNNIVAQVQNDPMRNTSIPDAGEKDEIYFEEFLIKFRTN